jgi:hypothetical protein
LALDLAHPIAGDVFGGDDQHRALQKLRSEIEFSRKWLTSDEPIATAFRTGDG